MNQPRYGAMFYFLGQFKFLYALILGVTLVVSVLESLSVAAFLPLFSSLLGGSSNNSGGVVNLINGSVGLLPISSPIVAASVILVVVFLLKTIGILTRDLMVAYAGAKVLYSVKKRIMERYSAADYQFMLDSQQGALIYNSLGAPASVSGQLSTLSMMITTFLKIIAIGFVLVAILPKAAMAFIALGVVYYLGIHYISRRISFSIGQGRARASTQQNIIANEFISGFRQIVTFNMAGWWEKRFDRENKIYSELYFKALSLQAIPRPMLELSALALLLGFVLILKLTSPGTIAEDLAGLGVFAVAMVQILPALNSFGGSRLRLLTQLPDVQIAHQVVTQAVPLRHEGTQQLGSLQNAIVFEDVSFAHKDREILLDRVNMSFEKGKVTAIVGPSGSGKTTLINLILGLFQPSEGQITVDGTPLKDLTYDTWLGRIGFVSQDPFTFNTTIEENIRFSREEHSRESVVKAAIIANAHDFISELPQGYDTLVGDRGMKLSGGEQQRVCIARAVIASPEILIFDEATSSLDSLSEKQVQEAIDKASSGRTVIMIAHRLSTIRNADKIIVLDNGRIVEQGTHQELLSKQGEYSRQVEASI